MNRVPQYLESPLERYCALTEECFPGAIKGIYLHGSLALDSFDQKRSDVDIVTVFSRSLLKSDRRMLRRLHGKFRRVIPWGYRVEVHYLPLQAAQDWLQADARFPFFQHGFYFGDRCLPLHDRALLNQRAITLHGPPANQIFVRPPWPALVKDLLGHLNNNWMRRSSNWLFFLQTAHVDHAVTSVTRTLAHLQTARYCSKLESLRHVEKAFPQWRTLLREVATRLPGAAPDTIHMGRMERASQSIRLIRFVTEVANREFGGAVTKAKSGSKTNAQG